MSLTCTATILFNYYTVLFIKSIFKLTESCHVEPDILDIYKYCKPRRDISGYNDPEMSRLTSLKQQPTYCNRLDMTNGSGFTNLLRFAVSKQITTITKDSKLRIVDENTNNNDLKELILATYNQSIFHS